MRAPRSAIHLLRSRLGLALTGAVWGCLVLCGLGAGVRAQEAAVDAKPTPQPAAAESSETLTLHVYAAHVQMPTMVLTSPLQPVRALPADRFRIRLDGGAPFVPSSLRPEGDDPLAVGVLLDAGGDENLLLPRLAAALIQLRTVALRPQDTLTLFAVDCRAVRYAGFVPHDAEGVEHALDVLLKDTTLHNGKSKPSCAGSVPLWHTMASVMTDLSEQPARRVLLALTAGVDHTHANDATSLRSFAAKHSIALFALTAPDSLDAAYINQTPLPSLCALTGGILLPLDRSADLPGRMADLVTLLRDRYILEFPRSSHLTSGSHDVSVEVTRLHPTVRITGLVFAPLDPRLRDDAHTVPYLEAEKPAVGTRHSDAAPPK